MFRYTILTVLLLSHCVLAQLYDETVDRKQYRIHRRDRNDLNPRNHFKAKRETVDEVVKWVNEIVKGDMNNESTTKPPNKLNLDPSNINIMETSFSKPAEASNKFDDDLGPTTPVERNCTTDDGRSGVCVVYYLCDPNSRTIITDGATILDERFGSSNCGTYLEICCELNDRLPAVDKAMETEKEQFHSSTQDEPSREVPYFDEVMLSPHNGLGGQNEECGWNRPDLFVFRPANQSIADGVIYANYGEFPWMVALLKKSRTNVWVQNDYIGGGSIIHPSVVVTAYHKLLQLTPEELKCRAGEWDTQTVAEQYQIQERDARQFVSHEDFFRTSVYNDIALIFLQLPFDLGKAPHIGTACLSSLLPDPPTGPCFSMGWGKVAKTRSTINILKKVKLALVDHESCRNMLHTNTRFRHIPNFILHESLTCAGGEEFVDTCEGDGGSSLVCPIGHRGGQTRYAVVGMVAYGLECGKKNVPGVYVNVPHLYDWVDQKMKDAGLSSSTYTF